MALRANKYNFCEKKNQNIKAKSDIKRQVFILNSKFQLLEPQFFFKFLTINLNMLSIGMFLSFLLQFGIKNSAKNTFFFCSAQTYLISGGKNYFWKGDNFFKKEIVFATNSSFLIPISMKPPISLKPYFKLRHFIVHGIYSLKYQRSKTSG